MIDRARFSVGVDGSDYEPRFAITEEGQPYLDEALYLKNRPVVVKAATPNPVALAFGVQPLLMTQPNIIRRTPLRWIKP